VTVIRRLVYVLVAVLLSIGVWVVVRPVWETEDSLYRTPEDKTGLRLRLAAIAIGHFYETNHRIPRSLRELGGDIDSLDAWGGSLSYEVRDTSITLRSAGPDRRFGTADDLIEQRTAPYFSEERHDSVMH
jgi:hypothetical protein